MATAKPYFIYPGFAFVCYPNRDSTPFRERYAIPEAQTVIRGTLRYQGFPEMIKVLVDIGFLSDEPRDFLSSSSSSPIAWNEATRQILGATSSDEKDLAWAISSKTTFANNEDRDRILGGLRWIGLFSASEQITPRANPLDTLCATLERKMQYEPHERDMVMLQHKFGIEHKNGQKETRTSTLCEFGVLGGYSAMAKTVGVPAAVAVKLVLDGTINKTGILAPSDMEICGPLLTTLKNDYGIEMIEKTL
ncbi:saccharopine dehydrogenase (NADP+, L-glutamate-forming) [Elasticomyces elasticus]|nr:saccharopine dehydrogenase (NADP+, L-glutamate-forming) [Elasticomyces elasticus]